MIPTNCLEINGINLPKVASPVIAVIGEEGNLQAPQQMLVDYLTQLFAYQQANKDIIDQNL